MNSHYHALCAVVSLIFVQPPPPTYPRLTSPVMLLTSFHSSDFVIFKNTCIFPFCRRDCAPVSCPILSNRKLWFRHSKPWKHVRQRTSSCLKANILVFLQLGTYYAPLWVLISCGMQALIGAAIFNATPLWVWHEQSVAMLRCFFVCACFSLEVTPEEFKFRSPTSGQLGVVSLNTPWRFELLGNLDIFLHEHYISL